MALRNLNQAVSSKRICGIPTRGVVGSQVSGVGQDGSAPLFNDSLNSSKEYRCEIITFPTSGTFYMWENSNFIFSGAPNGQYTAIYKLWEDGVDLGNATIFLNIGPTPDLIQGYKVGGNWLTDTATLAGYKVSGTWHVSDPTAAGYKVSGSWHTGNT